MTIVTKRIDGAISDGSTKRVVTSDAVLLSQDTWGGAWGDTWGRTWFSGTDYSDLKPTPDNTNRVGSAPSGGTTKRVSGI